MQKERFLESLSGDAPDVSFSAPLAALWWDRKGGWAQAHALVDELETSDAMAVHAYLHRKEGALDNAAYWYRRAGLAARRETLDEEWNALITKFLEP